MSGFDLDFWDSVTLAALFVVGVVTLINIAFCSWTSRKDRD